MRNAAFRFSFLIPLGVLIATLTLWQALLRQERVATLRAIDAAAVHIRDVIVDGLQADIRTLSRMGKRWEIAGKPPRLYWEADAGQNVHDSPIFQAIEWIDPTLHIRWMVPLKGNEAALNLNLLKGRRRASAILTARDQRHITISRPIDLAQGGKGFLVYIPLFHRNRFEGLIVGVFRIQTVLTILSGATAQGYTLTVSEGGEEVYTQGKASRAWQRRWGRAIAVELSDATWKLRVTPDADTLANYRSPLPPILLMMGLLTACLVSGLLACMQSARQSSQRARQSEALLAEAQRVAKMGSYEYIVATGEIIWSEGVYHLFYRDRALGPPTYEEVMACYHPDDLPGIVTARRQAFQNGQPYECDLRIRQRNGSYRWSHNVAHPLLDAEGNLLGIVGTVMDIHERKQAEEKIRTSEESLNHAQALAHIGSWELDLSTRQGVWSNEMFRLCGLESSLTPPTFEEFCSYIHPEDREAVAKHIVNGLDGELEFRMLLPDGTLRYVHAVAEVTRGADDQPVLMRGILMDITEREWARQQLETAKRSLEEANHQLQAANARLETLATTDGLTGLYNHRTYQERLEEEFARFSRYHMPLSVILLDVDKFKHYNDTFGHPAGDVVLKKIAQLLQKHARSTDFVARYGGEEFALILPETHVQEARATAERLRAGIEAHTWTEQHVTISLGIATAQSNTPDHAALIGEADMALYHSKKQGRNRATHVLDIAEDLAAQAQIADSVELAYADFVRQLLRIREENNGDPFVIKELMLDTYDSTIEGWARVLDLRDKETEGHSLRVTEMTVRLARLAGMNSEEVTFARWGALLHDIGKMGIPDYILHKPGPLTEGEWEIIKQHPTLAYQMLSPILFLQPVLDIPYCHHEKWDGTGYPRGLKGEEIPLAARLFAVVDVWDALTSHRPYRAAWSRRKAEQYLREHSGTQFDPKAVKVFLRMRRMDMQVRRQQSGQALATALQ